MMGSEEENTYFPFPDYELRITNYEFFIRIPRFPLQYTQKCGIIKPSICESGKMPRKTIDEGEKL